MNEPSFGFKISKHFYFDMHSLIHPPQDLLTCNLSFTRPEYRSLDYSGHSRIFVFFVLCLICFNSDRCRYLRYSVETSEERLADRE